MSDVFRMRNAYTFVVLVTCWAFSSTHIAHAQLMHDLLSGKIEMEKVVVPFRAEAKAAPALTMHVDRVYTDYQRKGFFRIGVLPIAVFEGVRFDISGLAQATNGLAHAQRWLGTIPAKRLELRNVEFVIPAGRTNCLQCADARILADGKWQLSGGVTLCFGAGEIRASQAVLQVTGAKAGQVTIGMDPILVTNLFSLTDLPNNKFKIDP